MVIQQSVRFKILKFDLNINKLKMNIQVHTWIYGTLESMSGMMAEYTTDNGRIIRCKVEGYLIGLIYLFGDPEIVFHGNFSFDYEKIAIAKSLLAPRKSPWKAISGSSKRYKRRYEGEWKDDKQHWHNIVCKQMFILSLLIFHFWYESSRFSLECELGVFQVHSA